MTRLQWITVGAIVGAHGIRGAVKVKPLTDFPDRLLATPTFWIVVKGERKAFDVEEAKAHGKGLFLLRLQGITDRAGAEALRGYELQVHRDNAYPLPKDTYYVFDLVGSDVRTTCGTHLGTLTDVLTTGANDVYVVTDNQGREVLIPAVKHVIQRIDLESGVVVVDPPEGLIEPPR